MGPAEEGVRQFLTRFQTIQDKLRSKSLEISTPNMTGRPGCRTMEMNRGSSAPYLASTPCVPLFCTLFNRGGNRRAFRLPGASGDHFHCTVEPSPGHSRCRKSCVCFRGTCCIPNQGRRFLNLKFNTERRM